MAVEDDLVSAVNTVLGTTGKVFSLRVYQQMGANAVYPCVVYTRVTDNPIEELDSDSGTWIAIFNVHILANTVAELRAKSALLVTLTGIYATSGWLQVTEDSESEDRPFENQEAGIHETLVNFRYIREGK